MLDRYETILNPNLINLELLKGQSGVGFSQTFAHIALKPVKKCLKGTSTLAHGSTGQNLTGGFC